MTDDAITTESMLQTLTWLVCTSCGGTKIGNINTLDDGDEHTGWVEEPCPSCQDSSGAATGLELPSLSEECPCGVDIEFDCDVVKPFCKGCREEHSLNHSKCNCQGRNRIPRRHDVLEAVLDTAKQALSLEEFTDFAMGFCENDMTKEAAIISLYAELMTQGLIEG